MSFLRPDAAAQRINGRFQLVHFVFGYFTHDNGRVLNLVPRTEGG